MVFSEIAIQSGDGFLEIALCDEFFEGLVGVDNVDVEVGNLLRQLYEEGRLTVDTVVSGLKNLREGDENEQQS